MVKVEFEFDFATQSNAVKVILRRSVNQLTLFLGWLNPLSGLPVLVLILSSVNDNWTSWISGGSRITVQMISWSTSTKITWPNWDTNLRPVILQADALPTTLRSSLASQCGWQCFIVYANGLFTDHAVPTLIGIHMQRSRRSETDRLTMKANVGVELFIQRISPMIVVMLPATEQ